MSITAFPGVLVRITYGVYAWIALIGVGLPTFIVLILTPTRGARRRLARWGARLFFLLIGSPVRVEGAEALPSTPSVVVANHASYLDGIILTAALPPNFTFLIKHEMATLPFAGLLLKRIGSEFVNREDSGQRHRVARRLLKAAERGDSLAFFPEGTFDRTPGLRQFQPGAFGAAWRAELPVVPIVIGGSRRKLAGDTWLCSPGPLWIRVCTPVYTTEETSATGLLRASRRGILQWLGEPDLAQDIEEDTPEDLSPHLSTGGRC